MDVSDRTSEARNLIVDQIVTRRRCLRNNCADDADREWRDDFYNTNKRKRKDLEVGSQTQNSSHFEESRPQLELKRILHINNILLMQ